MTAANFTDDLGNQPKFEAHRSYITGAETNACGYVMKLDSDLQCDFVLHTKDCQEFVTYFSYMNVMFCNQVDHNPIVHIILVKFWVIFLTFVLYVNARMVFTPSLFILGSVLKMGPLISGVTLHAMGNGVADVLSNFQKYEGDSEVMVNQSFGAAFFVTAFVGGIITICWPMTVVLKPYTWINVFYIVAIVYIYVILQNEEVDLWEAIGCLLLYLLFVAYLLFIHYRLYCKLKTLIKSTSSIELISALKKKMDHDYLMLKPARMVSVQFENKDSPPNQYFFSQFWKHIIHRRGKPFSEMNVWQRFVAAVSYPIGIMVAIMVPTANYALPIRGWCKLAVMINMFFVPPIWLVFMMFLDWTPYVYGVGVSTVLALIVLFTSRTDRPPPYHIVISCLAYATSVVITYVITAELVNALSTLFMVGHATFQTMALSVLAWGYSFGDLITNIYIARKKHVVCASVACYAAPISNILLGIFIRFIMRVYGSENKLVPFRSGSMAQVTLVFMILMLIMSTLSTVWSNMQLRRNNGILMLAVYGMWLVYAILQELQLIHGYGTDHVNESGFEI